MAPVAWKTMLGVYGTPGAVHEERLEPGALGLQQLVDRVQAAVQVGGKLPAIRARATQIIRRRGATTPAAQVQALYDDVADNPDTPYIRDPVDVQIIPGAVAACEQDGIDCKAKSVLVAAMIESIGFRTRMVTVDQNVRRRGKAVMHHIYPEWLNPETGKWRAVDTVMATIGRNTKVGDELPFKLKAIYPEPEYG